MNNESLLLGVAATSVPIKHMINTVPRYQVWFLSSCLSIVIVLVTVVRKTLAFWSFDVYLQPCS